MAKRLFKLCTCAVFAAAVATVATAEPAIAPRHAIEMAADAAPTGVAGTFDLQIRGADREDGKVFLDSEQDYRDQRCLTVEIGPEVSAALAAKYGAPPETFFKGKHLLVTGEAKRVTVWFIANGVKSNKYYYQTHVVLTDAGRLQVL